MRGMRKTTLAATLAWLLGPAAALAHAEGETGAGFLTGFLHPLGGLDHVLAMLAVGMWGALLGAPAIWALPVAFPLVMALGGLAGILALPVPPVEVGIVLSVVVLGAMIALERRPALWVASALVACFAVFHGYAHGTELPGQVGAVAYCAGFVISTGLIHLAGIGIGFVTKLPHGLEALRAGGAAIALAGVVLGWRLVAG